MPTNVKSKSKWIEAEGNQIKWQMEMHYMPLHEKAA